MLSSKQLKLPEVRCSGRVFFLCRVTVSSRLSRLASYQEGTNEGIYSSMKCDTQVQSNVINVSTDSVPSMDVLLTLLIQPVR